MNPAPNLILVGPTGAGKSTLGRRLAAWAGLPFHDLDMEIEQRAGAPVATLFHCEGEAGFRARECELLARLLGLDGIVLATGAGAVLDAGNRQLMRDRGFVVHLHADPPQQLARLAHDRSRPLLAGPDREAVLHRMATERTPLYREVAHLRFDTPDGSAAAAAATLVRLVETRWQPPASAPEAQA